MNHIASRLSLVIATVSCLSVATSFGAIIRNTAGGTETTPGAINTNNPLYGDAEVREEAVKYNSVGNLTRGDQGELATRRAPTNGNTAGAESGGNNSVMLMRFNIGGLTAAQVNAQPTTLRLTVNTTSFTAARANSMPTDPSNAMALQYGLQFYALKPTATPQNWDESTVRFDTAPGLTYDAGTPGNPVGGLGDAPVGFNFNTTPLGTVNFPIPTTGNVLVGTSIDLTNALLRNAILASIAAGNSSITILAAVTDNNTIGYNYIFAGNDTPSLLTQSGSPVSGASNADGRFSPTLFIGVVPEPASLSALALGGLLIRRRRNG